MSEMAGLVSSSLPRFSHVARRLEGQGWLTRRPDPTDRRYTLATLTEESWHQVGRRCARARRGRLSHRARSVD